MAIVRIAPRLWQGVTVSSYPEMPLTGCSFFQAGQPAMGRVVVGKQEGEGGGGLWPEGQGCCSCFDIISQQWG